MLDVIYKPTHKIKKFVNEKIAFPSWCWINSKKVYKWMKTASSSSYKYFTHIGKWKDVVFPHVRNYFLVSYYVLNYRHRSYWHISFHSRLNDWNVFPFTVSVKSLSFPAKNRKKALSILLIIMIKLKVNASR